MGKQKFFYMSSKGDGSAYHFVAIEKVKKLRQVDGKM